MVTGILTATIQGLPRRKTNFLFVLQTFSRCTIILQELKICPECHGLIEIYRCEAVRGPARPGKVPGISLKVIVVFLTSFKSLSAAVKMGSA